MTQPCRDAINPCQLLYHAQFSTISLCRSFVLPTHGPSDEGENKRRSLGATSARRKILIPLLRSSKFRTIFASPHTSLSELQPTSNQSYVLDKGPRDRVVSMETGLDPRGDLMPLHWEPVSKKCGMRKKDCWQVVGSRVCEKKAVRAFAVQVHGVRGRIRTARRMNLALVSISTLR